MLTAARNTQTRLLGFTSAWFHRHLTTTRTLRKETSANKLAQKGESSTTILRAATKRNAPLSKFELEKFDEYRKLFKDNWIRISLAMGRTRTPDALLRLAKTRDGSGKKISTSLMTRSYKPWRQSEINELRRLIEIHGNDWTLLSKEMGPERSAPALERFYRRKLRLPQPASTVELNEELFRNLPRFDLSWSKEELCRMAGILVRQQQGHPVDAGAAENQFPGRDEAEQCQMRDWVTADILHPKHNWSENDKAIFQAFIKGYGFDWSRFFNARLLPGKSYDSVKNAMLATMRKEYPELYSGYKTQPTSFKKEQYRKSHLPPMKS